MTGLSAAGKSTIAVILEQMLLHLGKTAYRLDGDNVRFGLNKGAKDLTDKAGYPETAAKRFGLGFSAEDRTENIRRIGEVAKLFADAGVIAVTSFISPYRSDRDAVRAGTPAGQFVEVYVKVSLDAAEKRDPKAFTKRPAPANSRALPASTTRTRPRNTPNWSSTPKPPTRKRPRSRF